MNALARLVALLCLGFLTACANADSDGPSSVNDDTDVADSDDGTIAVLDAGDDPDAVDDTTTEEPDAPSTMDADRADTGDTEPEDAGAEDTESDAAPDAIEDAEPDTVPDTLDECARHADCDDADPCTVDICASGTCTYTVRDADNDGSPDGACGGSDCDDSAPSISAGSERACTSTCGATGVERCVGGEWVDCNAPTECECSPGETREEPCARCGVAIRTCGDDGLWGTLGACSAPGECEPGDTRGVDCGAISCGGGSVAGTRTDTCDFSCAWTEGACVGAPACCPGAVENEACGSCGSRSRTCNAGGQWGEWTECLSPACCAGDEETQSCDDGCGTQTRTCVRGAWGPWGTCETEGLCCPGDRQGQGCNECGVQYRTCEAGGTWGVWSRCSNLQSDPPVPVLACRGGTTCDRFGLCSCRDSPEPCIEP